MTDIATVKEKAPDVLGLEPMICDLCRWLELLSGDDCSEHISGVAILVLDQAHDLAQQLKEEYYEIAQGGKQ